MYYVILDTNTLHARLLTDEHGLVEEFDSYEDADASGEIYKVSNECKEYTVVGECTDERHHIN